MAYKFSNPVNVTKPITPSRDLLYKELDKIFDSGIITNMGTQHSGLEQELMDYLQVSNVSVFNNGTIALITALKALDLPEGSEVITTAFTFAATAHSIAWNGLKPVFVDIDKNTMTLDPDKIEEAITPNSSAILPVHVYGFPCDVEAIDLLAKKYNLKVIYDGAHSFTTEVNGKSICNFGDITMLSFHATKLFNCIEGGALVYNNLDLKNKIYELRNFGIRKFTNNKDIKEGIKYSSIIDNIGLNGKLNELQAAWGRLVLKNVQEEQRKRVKVATIYHELFKQINNISIPKFPSGVSNSMQYFPIIFDSSSFRDVFYNELLKYNIYTRKYFYPLCSEFSCYRDLESSNKDNLINSHYIADRVLCLPFYSELLEDGYIENICNIIKKIIYNI